MRSAYARRREWQAKLEEAETLGNEAATRQALRFIAEYEDFIETLEQREGPPVR